MLSTRRWRTHMWLWAERLIRPTHGRNIFDPSRDPAMGAQELSDHNATGYVACKRYLVVEELTVDDVAQLGSVMDGALSRSSLITVSAVPRGAISGPSTTRYVRASDGRTLIASPHGRSIESVVRCPTWLDSSRTSARKMWTSICTNRRWTPRHHRDVWCSACAACSLPSSAK